MRRRLRTRLGRSIASRLLGEVDAQQLDAYRRAGMEAYDLLSEVEQKRTDATADPWSAPMATQIEAVCAWNAFVLQNLADELVDADSEVDRLSRGYLPIPVAAEATDFYHRVGDWISRARQAAANPGYALDTSVPQFLPRWLHGTPTDSGHLLAMQRAAETIEARVGSALQSLAEAAPAERAAELGRMRQMLARMRAAVGYAQQMAESELTEGQREEVGARLQEALDQGYLLGQVLACPGLLVHVE